MSALEATLDLKFPVRLRGRHGDPKHRTDAVVGKLLSAYTPPRVMAAASAILAPTDLRLPVVLNGRNGDPQPRVDAVVANLLYSQEFAPRVEHLEYEPVVQRLRRSCVRAFVACAVAFLGLVGVPAWGLTATTAILAVTTEPVFG